MSEQKKQRLVQLGPGRMKLAQFERQDYVANAPAGTTKEDILKPEFFALMAAKLKPYDRIEIRADDGSWIMETIVIGCDRTWAKVNILSHHELSSAAEEMEKGTGYRVKFSGPQKKWCVIRLSDSTIIREGIGTKDEAQIAIRELPKAG